MLMSKCKEKHVLCWPELILPETRWGSSVWSQSRSYPGEGNMDLHLLPPLRAAAHASSRMPFFCLRNNWKLGGIMRSSGISTLTSTPGVPPDEAWNTWGVLIDSASWRYVGKEWECRATDVRQVFKTIMDDVEFKRLSANEVCGSCLISNTGGHTTPSANQGIDSVPGLFSADKPICFLSMWGTPCWCTSEDQQGDEDPRTRWC